ncbi:MAG: hypothetical protein SV186_00165 [Candidatus Nanohaloarchaea archaeon]|nr:hypothetical protein [Candidatus Nanohaloarchaea archaeon]
MTAEYFIIAGIVVLFYGLYMALKLRDTLGSGELKQAWDLLTVLIGVFIVGYIGYICAQYFFTLPVEPRLVTGAVFFLGAIFVAVTARANYRVFQV